jgi:hypothetical protein
VRGIGVGVLVAVWHPTLQTQVEGEALGRVTAWDWMSSQALWPAGLAVAGPVAQAFGVTTVFWVSVGLGLVVRVGGARSTAAVVDQDVRDDAESEHDTAPSVQAAE